MEYYLEPRYDRRKSFYGKARVVETRNKNVIDKKLYSYGTEVARITTFNSLNTIYEYYGMYSRTTTRHQAEFFKQNGLDDDLIKKLRKDGKIQI